MNPYELLAAKVRGADDNAAGGQIIKAWYDEQVKHANNLAVESAEILRNSGSPCPGNEGLFNQIITNFDSISAMLNTERKQ